MKKENFTIKSVRLAKGVFTVKYVETYEIDGRIYHDNKTLETALCPHGDLISYLTQLKPCLIATYRLNQVDVLEKTDVLDLTPVQRQALIDTYKEINSSVDVYGISFSGIGDKEGVTITGAMSGEKNTRLAMKSGRIVFNNDTFGFEGDVEEICSKIKDETFEYLYNGKYSNDQQASIEFEDEPEDE